MLALAEYLEDEGDTTAASYYERVIDGFPRTPYANVARLALGMPPVDVVMEDASSAPPDSAAAGEVGPPEPGASGLQGPPVPAGVPEGPPPGVEPAVGDSVRAAPPPGVEPPPALSDSARARYEKYMKYSPAPSDSGSPDVGAPDEQGEEGR